jgi:hypothetical protein
MFGMTTRRIAGMSLQNQLGRHRFPTPGSRFPSHQLFNAYMTILTANLVLSSARKRLLRQS